MGLPELKDLLPPVTAEEVSEQRRRDALMAFGVLCRVVQRLKWPTGFYDDSDLLDDLDDLRCHFRSAPWLKEVSEQSD